MTDDTTSMPTGEEPAVTPEGQKPGAYEQSGAELRPAEADEQTITNDVPVDEQPTGKMRRVTIDEATQIMADQTPVVELATQITPGGIFAAASTVETIPQAGPPQAYEYSSAGMEQIPVTPYPNMPSAMPFGAEPPTGGPAPFYAEGPYPYAPYPGQPGQPGQPGLIPHMEKKRRSPALWIALVVVLVLLIGGGFAFILNRAPTNTPTQILQQFCHGYKTLNASEVYDTLSSSSQASTSKEQLQQAFDELKSLSSFVTISNCTVSHVQQNGSTATGQITLTDTVSLLDTSVSSSTSFTLKLVLENNTWKVDSTSSPDLDIPTAPAFPTFPPNSLTPTGS